MKLRRKIVRTEISANLFCRRYQALKPVNVVEGETGRWQKPGKEYTVKGIWRLRASGEFQLEFENGVEADIEMYEVMRKDFRRAYEATTRKDLAARV